MRNCCVCTTNLNGCFHFSFSVLFLVLFFSVLRYDKRVIESFFPFRPSTAHIVSRDRSVRLKQQLFISLYSSSILSFPSPLPSFFRTINSVHHVVGIYRLIRCIFLRDFSINAFIAIFDRFDSKSNRKPTHGTHRDRKELYENTKDHR